MTLVLLPGMDGTGQLFAPFVVALGHEFNVKVVRYPTTEPMGYAELEALARAALPEEGPFVILGESFSGPVAVSVGVRSRPSCSRTTV
jgi:pimeloyl-[acyl-carrier protein] methyl ester esterase